ncbi:MAG: SDR family NAD(P)-dependent oxidoreductase [Proteobacteria bacterium]|nr:SDR family NAD(P)-dependent oxidoreductase [Pseudomonadota bacterium]
MNVEGKAAIVTGGGTGVGKATALRLASLGCSVLVNYSRSKDGAEEAAAAAREQGVKGVAFQADVSDDGACRAMVEEAVRAFGRLDVLVNNAGTTSFIPHADLDRVSDDEWNRILGVNLKGPFFCARAARRALASDGGGEIVMTSSVAGLIGTGSSIPYCASKAALNNLTVTLARVMGPDIRVNAVAPGFIAGDWLEQGLGPAYQPIKQAMEQKSPLGRVCTAEDVSEAIVGVITGTDLVTGHVLPVEGGMLIGQ